MLEKKNTKKKLRAKINYEKQKKWLSRHQFKFDINAISWWGYSVSSSISFIYIKYISFYHVNFLVNFNFFFFSKFCFSIFYYNCLLQRLLLWIVFKSEHFLFYNQAYIVIRNIIHPIWHDFFFCKRIIYVNKNNLKNKLNLTLKKICFFFFLKKRE